MSDHEKVVGFIVISDLFERYTIVVNALNDYTSVYCTECEHWIGQWPGDQLSSHSVDELYELIIDTHEEQVLGPVVEIDDGTETFL